ncbi:MAG: hypothetical protein KAG66_01165, partial [Methylococcales bacterium]|nr:hypothetical protein [Methylococcales bacterium]
MDGNLSAFSNAFPRQPRFFKMSAIPEDFVNKTARLSAEVTQPFPRSKKIFIEGSRPDIRVGMREVECSSTTSTSEPEDNPPVTIYDTSGPFTDPDVSIDLMKGIPEVRSAWIKERDDTALLDGLSSEFGRQRKADTSLDDLRFEHIRTPLRAKSGVNVTQMHYARQGIITPEMEYVAIREKMRLDELRNDPRYQKLLRQHPGES